MCLFGMLFDGILLGGVAVCTHYALVQYYEKKRPLPKFVVDAVKSTRNLLGLPERERLGVGEIDHARSEANRVFSQYAQVRSVSFMLIDDELNDTWRRVNVFDPVDDSDEMEWEEY